MENIFRLKNVFGRRRKRKKGGFGRQRRHSGTCKNIPNTLASANINQRYIIKSIETNNDEMKDFLFTLGCYEGEAITLISIVSDQYIVVVKDARYSIDRNLASSIIV